MIFYYDSMSSPIGRITVVTDDVALRALDFEGYDDRMHRLLKRQYNAYTLKDSTNPLGILTRLADYFDGNLNAFDGVKTASNGTPFRERVWASLREITPGTTVSYGTIAQRIGQASASRAVGLANGSNPIGIVVPCHRVIGSNARLVGYGGGLDRKEWLLCHEGAMPRPLPIETQRTFEMGGSTTP